MVTSVRTRPTLDDFLRLPEEEPALEFIDGEICQKVSPKIRHSRTQIGLARRIEAICRASGRFLAFTELRCTFANRSVVPDVTVFRTNRLNVDAVGQLTDDDPGAPDFAVEIVSPSQSTNRLIARCVWYVENGVQAALLVDPSDQSFALFLSGRAVQTFQATAPADLSHLVPGLILTPAEIFADLSPAA